MANGRSIRIYLADGAPNGLRVTQIPGWTGRVVVCPASDLKRAREIEDDLNGPGIYVLVGDDPERDDRRSVYIGESENVAKRVTKHIQDGKKDFQTVIMIVATDDFLTKGHIVWLEHELINVCERANVATLDNDNKGMTTNLPRADQDDMRRFLDDILMVLPVLGFSFAKQVINRPKSRESVEIASEVPTFELSGKGVSGVMELRNGEYVVLAGSTAVVQGAKSWKSSRVLRGKLVEDGVLVKTADEATYEFGEAYSFPSPSAAACCILGNATNGREAWKQVGTGMSLKEWQAKQVESDFDEDSD